MKLMRVERETIITYNATGGNAEVYTADNKVIGKLDEYVRLYPSVFSVIGENEISKTYSVPKKYVKIIRPKNLTAAQKEAARERMSKLRSRWE